jgi:hypothetical protein
MVGLKLHNGGKLVTNWLVEQKFVEKTRTFQEIGYRYRHKDCK